MALIAVIFDTNSKELKFVKDGELQDQPREISFYRDWENEEKYRMSIYNTLKEVDGMQTTINVFAAQAKSNGMIVGAFDGGFYTSTEFKNVTDLLVAGLELGEKYIVLDDKIVEVHFTK